ncbi:hypothetical protein TNCV_812421 [Trichonephila clavipes]|nr:hypothetical protein TNCV_812421 [Trichonephila clavipes]
MINVINYFCNQDEVSLGLEHSGHINVRRLFVGFIDTIGERSGNLDHPSVNFYTEGRGDRPLDTIGCASVSLHDVKSELESTARLKKSRWLQRPFIQEGTGIPDDVRYLDHWINTTVIVVEFQVSNHSASQALCKCRSKRK